MSRSPRDERVSLGLALGSFGDPRLGLNRAESWVRLEKDGKPFWLTRFPITNHDYRAFIEARGYSEDDHWDEQGWKWLNERMPDPEKRFPDYWGDKDFNGPNQPVVGVSWYEARAFCRWLTETMRQKPLPFWKDDFQVGLPNNAEWGLAAGEGERKYPWGPQEPDATRANFGNRLGRTSPVGIYLDGATPQGLFDLAGNVWEWNADSSQGGAPFLRGGSWIFPAQYLASSDRVGVGAGDRAQYIGFRCRLGPPSRY